MLKDFVEIYRTRIYFQPIPLLVLKDLEIRIAEFPRFLRWSFFAVILHFLEPGHCFFGGKESEASEFYSNFARQSALGLASEGIASLELIQSLCILAFCDTLGWSIFLGRLLDTNMG